MYSKKTIEEPSPKEIKILFWTVFAGSRGCRNRVKIILQLQETPLNANQLSERLELDYKVVERHLAILFENELVEKYGYRYGKIYSLSPLMKSNLEIFNEMLSKSQNCKGRN